MYKMSFLQIAPDSGRQIKIERLNGDGVSVIYEVDNELFNTIKCAAANYSTFSGMYKIAPSYSYLV